MKTTQVRAIEMDPGDALFSIPTRCTPPGPKTTPITAATSCFRATTGLITPRTAGPDISHTAIVKIPDEDLARYQGKPIDRDGRSFYKPIVAAG